MNTGTRFPTILPALATISLAACDNPLTTPYQPSDDAMAKADGTASQAETTWFSGIAAQFQTSGEYQIEVIPVDAGVEAIELELRAATARWMRILRDTELPDIALGEGPKPECIGLKLDSRSRVVDDLVILASVRSIDGLGGTMAVSGTCWVHWDSSLPYLGALILDRADVEQLDARDLKDLISHEIGHILGIGTLWSDFGLLRNPSRFAPGADTHFEGPLAIAAFDAAGGVGYLHGKVPVENLMGPGSADVHWRESVLGPELMTPILVPGKSNHLSTITIQSLSDMGYTVDLAQAEEFTVPRPSGGGGSNEGDDDQTLSLVGDVQRGPLLGLDPEGGAVRVLRR